jgi:hypothetical protein
MLESIAIRNQNHGSAQEEPSDDHNTYMRRALLPNPEGVISRSPGQAERSPGYMRPPHPQP